MEGGQTLPNKGLCRQCKGGRLACGEKSCPLLRKLDKKNPVRERLSDTMFGPSESVFIGWKNYPNVFAGPMTAIDEDAKDILKPPSSWYGLGFDDIVFMRSRLVRGRQTRPVKDRTRFTEKIQELALSVSPVDVESLYRKKPSYSLTFSPIHQPVGATGDLKRMRITENPVIPRRVDKIVSDDLRSNAQVTSLFDKNMDVYYLTNVLSSGALGMGQDKKMVPTRWSITAVDDMLAKHMMERIRDHPHIKDISVVSNEYLGNHFEILLIPGAWEFELFEAWSPGSFWGGDGYDVVAESESYGGRTKYAYNEGGGYYAGRFSVCEALDRMRKSARAVVFREIYDTYVMPVGVWEVRENVRVAMEKKPVRFDTVSDALRDIGTRLKVPMDDYLKKSQILPQSRLTEFG